MDHKSLLLPIIMPTAFFIQSLSVLHDCPQNDGGSEPGSSTNLLNKDSGHDNRMIMKKILVKCADISNPCRPLPLCKIWAERIAEEYFLQVSSPVLIFFFF